MYTEHKIFPSYTLSRHVIYVEQKGEENVCDGGSGYKSEWETPQFISYTSVTEKIT